MSAKPTHPTQTIGIIERAYSSCGKLQEVIYMYDGNVYALDVAEEDRMEFEYPDEEPEYVYDEDMDMRRPSTRYITPDDLTDAQLYTLITAQHNLDDEPLYTMEEWIRRTIPAHTFCFELENQCALHTQSYEEMVSGELVAKVWATYNSFAKPSVQVVRVEYHGIDLLPFIIKVLKGTSHVEGLFKDLEKQANEIFERTL